MHNLLEHVEFDTSLSIGVRTRQRRWMLGMSRQSLANAMGVGLDVIEAFEAGERQLRGRILEKLAAVLGISPLSLDSSTMPLNPERKSSGFMPLGA